MLLLLYILLMLTTDSDMGRLHNTSNQLRLQLLRVIGMRLQL